MRGSAISNIASLSGLAALIGEPARTAILVTLMDGRALTAGELACAAGVAPSTASGHLGLLQEAGLLTLERQGRFRYYRLASKSIAELLETMMAQDADLRVAVPGKRIVTGPRDRALRRARTCYDHLAGEVAVGIADALIGRDELNFGHGGATVTAQGMSLLHALGVGEGDMESGTHSTACRPCLDWSERRPHIGGPIGAGLYRRLIWHGWIRPIAGSRAVTITPKGVIELRRHFGLALN